MLTRHMVLRATFLLLLLSLAASHNSEDGSPDERRKRLSDPMSNFFSELGDMLLDVDKAIAVESRPKIEHEANVASQLFRPRSDYFNRIQENYKELQKRLGNLIGNTIGFRNSYSDHELTTVNPPENFSPTIDVDHNPFAAADARKEKLKQRISKGSSRAHVKDGEPTIFIPKAIDESFKAFSKLSQAIVDDIGEFSKKSPKSDKIPIAEERSGYLIPIECNNEILEDPELEERRQERCSRIKAEELVKEDLRKVLLEPKRNAETLLPESTDGLDELFKGIGRSGDTLIENIANIPENFYEREVSDIPSTECSEDVLDYETLEKARKERCDSIAAERRFLKDLGQLLKDPNQSAMKQIPIDFKDVYLLSVLRRSGDTAEDENLSNAFLDSSLDQQVRQLLKDHGSWILDYPLLKRWRQRNRSFSNSESEVPTETEYSTLKSSVDEIEPTELYLPVSSDYMSIRKSGETAAQDSHRSYYKIVNKDGDVIEDEVDFVLEPEPLSNGIHNIEMETHEPKETVILAFTSDGVPLKLSLGPEIDNPIQYLHKALQSAGVSLNIPVESYDDLEPVGKEVLKLGSGILTRAVAINASNPNELKALLKALMASKSSGKTIF